MGISESVGAWNEKIDSLGILDVAPRKLAVTFRTIAQERLAECKYVGIHGLEELKDVMVGDNEQLTEAVLLDCISIISTPKGDTAVVCMGISKTVSRMMGCGGCSVVSFEELRNRFTGDAEVEGYKEKYEGDNFDYDPDEYEDDEGKDFEEDLGENLEVEKEPKKDDVLDSELGKKICNYYNDKYNGVIAVLLKRYTALFSSGYELNKPAGILSSNGIVRVSGGSLSVYEYTASTNSIYELIKQKVNYNLVEMPNRSIVKIANTLNDYFSAGTIIYFPNKMLEFAFGLKAPTGDNQDSENTYTEHANASNWELYCNGDLRKSITKLITRSSVGFVINTLREQGLPDEEFVNPSIGSALEEFLEFVKRCLSFCIVVPEYKLSKKYGVKAVSAFKIRVCDPAGTLLNEDLTQQIIDFAFMGNSGEVPFSYQPLVEPENFMVEYRHEFNHNLSQATPLFAYKALESIKAKGETLSWDNMILGMSEKGTILRSLPADDSSRDGIKLGLNLTHNISAGSRAGKGVMTLNILASGIASNKCVFYLDRKPDMASLFKYMAPKMFVINGSDWQAQYDMYNTWHPDTMNAYFDKTPVEVLEAFDVTPTWANLGDLVYMRALKLAVGIIMLRGSATTPDPRLGGNDGILLVVDEFTNFQASYMKMLSNLTKYIPNIQIDKARAQLEEGKISQVAFDKAFNNRNYYALSYMLSAMKDVEYIDNKKRAGFNPMETSLSDVFVIGQDMQFGEFKYNEFKDSFQQSSSSARKKTPDGYSLNASGFNTGTQSIPFSIVNFKTADAFFGRNDQGYLAAGNRASKACGKLDDKASNFAYMKSFTESTRQRMVANRGNDNVELANECKYFKPFLILNSSGLQDQCVMGMFERVQKFAGVSPEELTAENPSYSDPSRINEAIGFIDYINMAGCNDEKGVLEKSSVVANYVVQQVLRYPGDWMQFVTDFSPEWLFTIEDIVLAGTEGDCPLFHPDRNPVLKEYYDFNPERFGDSYEDSVVRSQNAMDDFFYDDSLTEDFSDIKEMEKEEDERMGFAMGDFDTYDDDEEISFEDDKDDFYQTLNEGTVNETGFGDEGEGTLDDDTKRIMELLRELNSLGVNIEVGDTLNDPNPVNFSATERSEFGEEFERIDYQDDINSLENLMSVITNDIIRKFGGLERITSFKVIGGGIVVNGYYYRCKIKDLFARNIPYDIRRDINAGNISKLFNYGLIRNMIHIRDLEIDSVSFAYDYVSTQMGYDNSISVDKFFNDLRSLQVLTIGRKRFDRNNYIAQANGEDIFYKPKKSTEIADASEAWLGKMSNKSWSFTKNAWSDRNCGRVAKVLKVTGGTAATVATGTAKLGSQATRKAIKGIKVFGNGIKDLFNS